MDQAEGTPNPGASVALTLMTTFLNTTLDDYYYTQPCLDACNASFAATDEPDTSSNTSSSGNLTTVSTLSVTFALDFVCTVPVFRVKLGRLSS